MAQTSGFFNALKTGTTYDRQYNANDYSDNMGAIITTGVRRSGDNDLYVQASGGMALSINAGRAWIEGKWYKNDTAFTDFSVPTAPTGDRGRVDRVVLKLDNSVSGRLIELVYKTGTPAADPTAPALERSGDVYEIALADIAVNPNVTTITQSDIYDRRPHTDVCGWITSPVGYDDYFTNLDTEFNTWFTNTKDTLASVTMIKQYTWSEMITDPSAPSVTFNIPQYDPTGTDIVKVVKQVGTATTILFQDESGSLGYTLSGSTINFNQPQPLGTTIHVFVYKSIDGTGLGSVSDEVTTLQNDVAKINEFTYFCNGSTDNVELSDIAQNFLASDTDYDQMTVYVRGTFGATTPYAGAGSSSSRYRWMSLGAANTTKKRIIFDFANCSKIELNCLSRQQYIGIYGAGVNILNANIESNAPSSSSFVMFSSTATEVYARDCRFRINGSSGCYISGSGTFDHCKATVINSAGNSSCFTLAENGLLRINGGEYYSYSADSSNVFSYVIDSNSLNGCIITNGMNCPTVARSTLKQQYAIKNTASYGAANDTITTLLVESTASTKFNVRGTYAVNLPDR